ncbi:MAG TPA: class I SAM-dependent methyltransferase [Solirubrobacterales bacterium]|nr:class I SAM-dependent methyltransferase [Solirubrobacterales bacterium]
MGLKERLAPGSPAGDAAYRLLMLGAGARPRPHGGRGAAAVTAALLDAGAGRLPAEERAWLDRIEAHRHLLPATTVEHALDTRGLERETWLAEASRANRWMSLPPIAGRLVIRLVRELRPSACVELGTGFGVSAAYQAAALELNGRGRLVSLDVEGMTAIARPFLAGLGLEDRVSLRAGRIEDTLDAAITDANPVEFALLDHDHTGSGTLAAFDALLPALADGAVVVLDDVNWTEEMREAWRVVRRRERVATAVTVRRLGIVAIAEPAAAGE